MKRVSRELLKAPVYLYRYLISPLLGESCRYHPTCSAYALEALDRHGPFKGAVLTVLRLSRCHPWSRRNGIDPVPTRFTWRGCFGYKRQQSENCS